MSYSYRISRNPLVFVHRTGEHPGRALCHHCRRRIPRTEPRLGYHGHYYCIPCWFFDGQGREFLETLLSVLNDEMLEAAGLRVERDEPETEPSSYNLNDFGVRILRNRNVNLFESGHTYNVEYFTCAGIDGSGGETLARRFEDPTAANPEDIAGARVFASGSEGNSRWMPRIGNFEVVLLETAPEPDEADSDEEPHPPDAERVMSETGVLAEVGDTVRFVRNMTPDNFRHKPGLLGQKFVVRSTSPTTTVDRGGRQWYELIDVSNTNFYDDELVLVRRAGEPEPAPEAPEPEADESEWVDATMEDLSIGDTVRIKMEVHQWGSTPPGTISTIATMTGTGAHVNGHFSNGGPTTWYYPIEQLEVQR